MGLARGLLGAVAARDVCSEAMHGLGDCSSHAVRLPSATPCNLLTGLADAAAALLALADDNGLTHLRAVALDYIVHHHDAVKATESYLLLTRRHLALVAEEACAVHSRMVGHIRRIADQQPLPEPSY